MRFRVLGPVELSGAAGPVTIGSSRQRSLLALLLARTNRIVSLESLVEDLWNGRPPATARKALHVHLTGLRRALKAAGAPQLKTEAYGYQLSVDADDLDLLRFERLAAEGRRAMGRPEEAARLLREALELWRGAPFADAPLDVLQREVVPALESARQAALEDRIQADLERGRHHELVGELGTLVASHPVRERVRGQLMVALYRCGRQTEALEIYRDGRKLLVDELGIEPGPELRRLEHAILTADPALDPPFSGQAKFSGQARTPRPIPAQLPAGASDFVGRDDELKRLAAAIETKPIVAVCGKAGVGKTTLALELAHAVKPEFADGQLYADLRGPTGEAKDVGEVAGMLLRGLGVEPAAVPASTDERTALYRSLLAGRRLLVVLDNATDTAMVRALLPGESRCAVLLTSRTRPTGLPGATIMDVDVFAEAAATELLDRIVADERIAQEPDEAARIARYCGYLPLAVRIAGARLAARPHWSVRRLADLLSNERRRLDTLVTDDLDVRSSLTISENELHETDRRALRLLSIPDVPDLADWLIGPVLDREPTEANEIAERLVEARLLDADQNRYRFHDLIRLHARQSTHPRDRTAVIARVAGAVLGLADVVVRPYQEAGFSVDPDPALRYPTQMPANKDGWWPAATGMVGQAAKAGMLDLASETLERVAPYASAHGYHAESQRLAEVVRTESTRRGDCRTEVIANCVLAIARYEADDLEGGRRLAEDTLGMARTADLPGVEARLLQVVADVLTQQGDTHSAIAPYLRALTLHRGRGDPLGEAFALSQLGWAHRILGNPVHALTDIRKAVAILRRLDRPRHLCRALIRIGATETLLHRPDAARAALTEALELCAAFGYGRSESVAHFRLGNLARETGDLTAARAHLEAALAIGNRFGERLGLGWVVLALGKTHTAGGEPERALEMYDEALTIFREFDARSGEAFTHQHMGLALQELGRIADARQHLTTAIGMLDELADTHHAAAARAMLTSEDRH